MGQLGLVALVILSGLRRVAAPNARRKWSAVAIGFVAALASSGRSSAETFFVTNANDSGPGSFAQAVIASNATTGVDSIEFAASLDGSVFNADVMFSEVTNLNLNGADLTFSGSFSGPSGYTVLGDGVMVLEGMSSIGGNIAVVSGSTIRIEDPYSLGTARFVNNGTLDLDDGIVIENNITVIGDSSVVVDSGASELQGFFRDLSGTSVIRKDGQGELYLTGSNQFQYFGEIVVQSGTLRVASGESLGGSNDLMLDGGTLRFDDFLFGHNLTILANGGVVSSAENDLTISGIVSGSGRLTKTGPFTLTLTGQNNFSGGLSIDEGFVLLTGGEAIADGAPVQIVSGGLSLLQNERIGALTGSGGTVSGSGRLTVEQDVDGVFRGDLVGSGFSFRKDGAGSLELAGSIRIDDFDVREGHVVLSGETTSVRSGPVVRLADGTRITVKGSVFSDRGGSDTFSGGNADVLIAAGGSVVARRANSASVNFVERGPGVSSVVIEQGGRVDSLWSTAIVDEEADGDAELRVTVAGTLRGFETAIQFGGGDDALVLFPSAQIDGAVNAAAGADVLVLGGTGNGSFAADAIGPTSQFAGFEHFRKDGTSTWTLTGSDNGDTDWSVLAGTLVADSNSLVGDVANEAQLTFDQDFNGRYDGSISGTGTLLKTGAGVLELTGSSTLSGPTHVRSGSLINNGSLVGPVFVEQGGLVGGNGSFGEMTLGYGSTVAPGNSIGTLTINGDVHFNAGSIMSVEVSPNGTNDLLVSSGSVTISETETTLQVIGLPGSYPPTSQFTVIEASKGVDGSFETIVDNLPDVDLAALYSPNSVVLVYTRSDGYGDDLPDPSEVPPGTKPHPISPVPPPAPSAPAFSPKEVYPSSVLAAADTARLFGTVLRLRATTEPADLSVPALPGFGGRADVPAFAAYAANVSSPNLNLATSSDWTIWSGSFGGYTGAASNGLAYGWDAWARGGGFGLEHRLKGEHVSGKIGLSAGNSRTHMVAGLSQATIESWHAGLYGMAAFDPLTVAAWVAYAQQSYAIERPIPFLGGIALAASDARGYSFAASFEAFINLYESVPSRGDWQLGPMFSISTVHSEFFGATESGAGILDLTVKGLDVDQVVLGFGFGVQREIDWDQTDFRLWGTVGWQHALGDLGAVATASIPTAKAVFSTPSAAKDRGGFVVGVGVSASVSDSVSTHFEYGGAFTRTFSSHRANVGVSLRF